MPFFLFQVIGVVATYVIVALQFNQADITDGNNKTSLYIDAFQRAGI